MNAIEFEVFGIPAPKGSSRAVARGRRAFVVPSGSDANRKARVSWDNAVRDAAREAVGDIGSPVFVQLPLIVSIVFRLKRPAGHWARNGGLKPSAPPRPHTKPDLSKILRATEDAMNGIVYDDDARIVGFGRLDKEYARPGMEGAWIEVKEWKE